MREKFILERNNFENYKLLYSIVINVIYLIVIIIKTIKKIYSVRFIKIQKIIYLKIIF